MGFTEMRRKKGFLPKRYTMVTLPCGATELVEGLEGTKIALEEGSFHEYQSVEVKQENLF